MFSFGLCDQIDQVLYMINLDVIIRISTKVITLSIFHCITVQVVSVFSSIVELEML